MEGGASRKQGHLQRKVFAVLDQQALVYVRGLLEVRAQVVHRCKRQLVLGGVGNVLVVGHQLCLVIQPVIRDDGEW